jgi:DNA-binding CsgD family transcriptional regulator
MRSREVALVADFLYDLHTPVAAEDFARHIVSVASHHLKGYRVCFDQSPLKKGRYQAHTSHPTPCPNERVGQIVSQSPSYQYAITDGRERVIMITDFVSQRAFQRTDFYQEVFKAWDVHYQVAACLKTKSYVCGFSFHRDRPIGEEFRGILQAVYPHIERAFENAQMRSLPSGYVRLHAFDLPGIGLTRRESEVLLWIAEGKRDAEIAKILGVSRRTASKHVENILEKLEAETRTAAVARAAECLRKCFYNCSNERFDTHSSPLSC